MNRLIYPIVIAFVFTIFLFVVEPFLYELLITGVISKLQYCIVYWSLNASVTIVLAVIIYSVGKNTSGVKQICGMIIVNALLDLVRIYLYPNTPFLSGVFTFFTGIYIFAYGIVISKKMTFKKGAGTFFLLFGPIYWIRFPFFVDVLMFYSRKFITSSDQAIFYLNWNIYPNYLVIILELIALDFLLREKRVIQSIKARRD